ncbi:MAG TPA: cell division protein ZapA [Comamonas sp.]
MSQLSIQILHQDYLLTCPDGQEAQLREAVERVDQQFQAMRDTSKLRSRERIGVLLAVNLAYENLELRKQLQALQQQVSDLQSTQDPVLTEVDAERLQALEAQAVHDQALAATLAARLDEVLGVHADAVSAPVAAVETAEPSLPTTMPVDNVERTGTDDVCATAEPSTALLSNTDFDSEMLVGLSTATEESL